VFCARQAPADEAAIWCLRCLRPRCCTAGGLILFAGRRRGGWSGLVAQVADARRRGAVEARTYGGLVGRRLQLDVVELESDLGSRNSCRIYPMISAGPSPARVLSDQSYDRSRGRKKFR